MVNINIKCNIKLLFYNYNLDNNYQLQNIICVILYVKCILSNIFIHNLNIIIYTYFYMKLLYI